MFNVHLICDNTVTKVTDKTIGKAGKAEINLYDKVKQKW